MGGWVSPTNRPTGSVVQRVETATSALASGSTTMPADDTIPQSGEGVEFITLAITPKSTTNRLDIRVNILLTNTVANFISVALFQDATADAIFATCQYQPTAGGPVTVSFTHSMAAGTVSSTTFKVRAGGNAASSTIVNGNGVANRLFSTIPKTTMTITEYKA